MQDADWGLWPHPMRQVQAWELTRGGDHTQGELTRKAEHDAFLPG